MKDSINYAFLATLGLHRIFNTRRQSLTLTQYRNPMFLKLITTGWVFQDRTCWDCSLELSQARWSSGPVNFPMFNQQC